MSIEQVRNILQEKGEPTRETQPHQMIFYHEPKYGVWVFFNSALIVEGIRYEAPYRGLVRGVAVGNDKKQVRKVLGKPDREWPIDDGIERWIYERDGFLRVDFDPNTKKVKKIFR